MDIKSLQDNWNRFGETDPLWSILTDPAKRGGRWNPAEFFETGRAEIAQTMAYLESLPVTVCRGRALDFGCGVGRLTQALCEYFEESHGVDIASSMIRRAREFNRFGPKAVYHLNERSDLALFEDASFDFIYSRIVLQHMRPSYQLGYLREFVRLLKPGGVALFQLPAKIVATDHPMALSAFQAHIETGPVPRVHYSGTNLELSVRVKNISDSVWKMEQGRYCFRLGNHWLDDKGRIVVNDDGRVALPHDLRPGGEVVMSLIVHVPTIGGRYFLELDMVLEGVAWFRDRGSQTARASVRVVGNEPRSARIWCWLKRLRTLLHRAIGPITQRQELAQTSERTHEDKPWLVLIRRWFGGAQSSVPCTPDPIMEMYGTPREQVLAAVKDAGGEAMDTLEDGSAGPGWIGYTYCITKPVGNGELAKPARQSGG